MPVITIGAFAGTTWGLTAESGMIVQSYTAKSSREKNQLRNAAGDVVAVAFYNQTQAISLNGIATTGYGTPAAGVALTVANMVSSGQGQTAGSVFVDDIEISKTNTEFMKITVNATRYLLLTTP